MANIFKIIARRLLFSKQGNLVSFDEPYRIMRDLLGSHEVTGIVDAGASNGRISRRLLRYFPKAHVYAFEPNPLYRETLDKQAAANVRLHPQFNALSDKECSVDLNITRSPGTTSLFKPSNNLTRMYPAESEIHKVFRVDAVTLDTWAERNGSLQIQLMKFDIQGGELKAFEGADRILRDSVLAVYTEILFNPLYEGGAIYSEIDLCLRKRGFVLYDLYKPRYSREKKLLWANALFIHEKRLGI